MLVSDVNHGTNCELGINSCSVMKASSAAPYPHDLAWDDINFYDLG